MNRLTAYATNPAFRSIVKWATGLVWLFMGIWAKLLDMIPRHRMIVARILGDESARPVIMLIGLLEVLLALWVLSDKRPTECAVAQTALLLFMNFYEFKFAPDLLILGYMHAALSVFFIASIWYVALTAKARPSIDLH